MSVKCVLVFRVTDCGELDVSETDVSKLVTSIEVEMFDIFRNTDSKYMNKYRTIMFNLKDPKNKVCNFFNLIPPNYSWKYKHCIKCHSL